MTAADLYLAALREAVAQMAPVDALPSPKTRQDRKPQEQEPKRLSGGCLLYAMPLMRAKTKT